MMPDAELSVVGEGVAKETPVIGWTGEGDRFLLSHGIDNGVYVVAELPRSGIEIDAVVTAEVFGRIRRFIPGWEAPREAWEQ